MLSATLVLALALTTGAVDVPQDATPPASSPRDPASPPSTPQDNSEAKEPPTPPHTGVRALLDGVKKDFQHLGHASVTFASATVIERHLGWKQSTLGYTIASYVAASRLHDNRHYLSDVVFGAAVGAIAGRTVTQHGRDSWTLVPVRVPGGVAVVALRRSADARR